MDDPSTARRAMGSRLGIIIMIIVLLVLAATARGEERQAPHARAGRGVAASVAFVPVLQGEADLEGGSGFGVSRYLLLVDLSKRLDQASDLGLSLFYDYEKYDFSGPTALGGQPPWDAVHRIGLAVPWEQRLEGGWRLTLAPSAGFDREAGASWSRAISYGGVLAAGKRLSDALTLGIGVGAFYRLEEVKAYPVLAVNWKISERVRLRNPLRTGPAGPAGLELAWAVADGWELGLGGAYRSTRFRLDGDGVAPGGVGEVRAVPAWLRLSRGLGPVVLDLHAGAVFGGRLALEDEQGARVAAAGYDPAPFAALRIQARF